jgi:mono/diheme cytochrome c family protein
VKLRRIWALAAVFALAAPAALAQSVANGEALYRSICISCHSLPPVGGARLGANNPTLIRQAINGLVPDMKLVVGPLNFSDAQLADIAAYLATVVNDGSSTPTAPVPASDYSDLWWNPDESGWGFNITQHATNVIFGVMYTYGPDRKPLWFVLPSGTWIAANMYSGPWYQVSGPSQVGAFDPSATVATQVGTATITFSDASHATLAFTVNGTLVSKTMTRQSF